MPGLPLRSLRSAVAPIAVIVGGMFAFCAPSLVNAAGTNSDAAVVGLQAMHLLRGEHALFLWGSGYQTSVDSYVAAAVFAVLGPTPFALMASALGLLAIAAVATWDAARRATGDRWLAVVLVSPLVLGTAAVHTYALYPPRQASLTLATLALWAVVRGASSARRTRWAFAGGALALLALFADSYALLFVPVAALLALLALPGIRARLAWLGGALAGAVPVLLRARHPAAAHGVLSLSADALGHNAALLRDPCGPWALGVSAWAPVHLSDWAKVDVPWPVRAIQWAGLASFFAALVGGGIFALRPRLRASLAQRAGVAGLALVALTVGGFLFSRMIFDHFAMRYLAAISFAMPFAAAPLAARLGRARFAALFAPWVLAGAISGWIGQGPFVRGGLPARPVEASGAPEAALAAALADRGIHVGLADYWAAYRVTFVTRESLVLVPLHAAQDRYAPYRESLARAPVAAYVFDPGRSGEDEGAMLAELAKDGWTAGERIEAGGFRVTVLRHVPAGPIGAR